MKKLNQITLAVLLIFILTKVSAQTKDTITVAYSDTIRSGYSAACSPGVGCLYTLPVVLPPNFTVSEMRYSFSYSTGSCNAAAVGFTISLGSCQSLSQSSGSASIYNNLSTCLLTPACISDTLNFILNFFRCLDPGGACSASSCVTVASPWSMSIIGKRDACPTGIIEHQNSHSILTIYPNPANTEVILHSSSIHPDETAVASVINIMGEVLFQKEIKWSSEERINIKELPAGMYFVQVTDNEGRYIGRFVKE